jgi:hypothetical protein
MARGANGTWMAFLAITIGIVGLTGIFATYAAPLPLERALSHDAALDEVLAGAGKEDPAALAALRERLGSSAGVLEGPADTLPARVAAERARMRKEMLAEADAIAVRLRWLIGIITLTAIFFGSALVGAGRR